MFLVFPTFLNPSIVAFTIPISGRLNPSINGSALSQISLIAVNVSTVKQSLDTNTPLSLNL